MTTTMHRWAPTSPLLPVLRPAWLDGVNPVTKIVLALLLSVPLFASIDPVSALVAIALQLLCLPLTGLPVRTVLLRLAPIALFSPIAGLSMLLYAEPEGEVFFSFGFAAISEGSIALAVAVTLRVIALGLPTILLFGRTDPTELGDALAQVAHLPSRFVLGALAAWATTACCADSSRWRSCCWSSRCAAAPSSRWRWRRAASGRASSAPGRVRRACT